MAGKIRQMIDTIMEQKAKDNPMMERVIKAKMILKGINPVRYTDQSEDDPAIISQLESMMATLGAAATPSSTAASRPAPMPAAAPAGPSTSSRISKSANARIKTGYSTNPFTPACIGEIRNQLAEVDPSLVIFFSSTKHAPAVVSRQMQSAFPKAKVIGCSTAGEIVSGHMLTDSIVAMGFSAEAAGNCEIQIIENPASRESIEAACKKFESHFGESMAAMDPSSYVGILLIDGLAGAEEGFMANLGDLTNVNFIGGSAGDDLKFSGTHLYAQGKSHTGAAVIALLKPGIRFSFIKTQSFRLVGKTLRVTKANESSREVLQFNDKPAVEAYAEAIGVPVGELSQRFMRNPIGLIIEGEPYVRSPQQVKGGSVCFYCGVKEGMKLSLLESTDIIADTRNAIAQAEKDLGGLSALIDFDCILRTLALRNEKLTGEYGKLFEKVPTIGFSTYGEQYIGHINQTATMLAFG
ncbi:MAG: FIST N-terminal domain-containing protein [Syntrophotaleaceae bacterium]